jgi:hypothetical protein
MGQPRSDYSSFLTYVLQSTVFRRFIITHELWQSL